MIRFGEDDGIITNGIDEIFYSWGKYSRDAGWPKAGAIYNAKSKKKFFFFYNLNNLYKNQQQFSGCLLNLQ